MAEVANFISQVGFPVFVACVLLWRVDRMHVENIQAINALREAISSLDKCLVDRFRP